MEEMILRAILENGISGAIAFYILTRLTPAAKDLTKAVDKLTEKIDKLEARMNYFEMKLEARGEKT